MTVRTIDKAIKSALPVFAGIIAIFISITSMYSSISDFRKGKTDLSTQITDVSEAISGLRTLEKYLEQTKAEMLATQAAKEKIEKEYLKAKELEKLSKDQLEAISMAVNKRTFNDILKDQIMGFVLGVAGSLVATFIYNKIKK